MFGSAGRVVFRGSDRIEVPRGACVMLYVNAPEPGVAVVEVKST